MEAALAYKYRVRPRVSVRDLALHQIPITPDISMSNRMRVPNINVNQRAIEMQMMKALLTHPSIVHIISIDQQFRNYKHGVYVPSLDEPCKAHTHVPTLLGWGTYEENITGFGLKKRKRDEAPNVGVFGASAIHEAMIGRLVLVMHRARYEAESKSGKLASGDSAFRRMETTTTSVVSSLISHYNGLSLGSNKSEGASDTRSQCGSCGKMSHVLFMQCTKESHRLVDRRMAEIWNFKEQHMYCFLLACVAL
ncbi:hypothetical protein FF1_009419 [Malus domestica]